MQRHKRSEYGFTLVELSIVLVILGLLVGGVLSGQSLIRAAQLRAVVREKDQIVTATMAFRDKYFSLPGDLTNATSRWSGTSNGNGDGQLSKFGITPPDYEPFLFWQHLALAGLIEGTYTGTASTTRDSVIGVNVMKSKIDSAGWSTIYWPAYTDANDFTPAVGSTVTANILMFGQKDRSYETYNPAITPAEAYNIDMKVDDGKIVQGSIRLLTKWASNCATTTNSTTAEYNLSYNGIACPLYFVAALP